VQCPYCKEDSDWVVNSRPSADGGQVRRRRECKACGRRFTTYERIEQSVLRVIKKDKSREDFDPDKVLLGMDKACYRRPISGETLRELAQKIEKRLHQHYEGEVSSEVIGEMVMEELRGLDHVAYIRFASVYRDFKDAGDFIEEVGALELGLRASGHSLQS